MMGLQIPRDQGIGSGQEVSRPADQVLGSWHGVGAGGPTRTADNNTQGKTKLSEETLAGT